MGWRLFRSLKIAPGVRLNMGKRGLSVSLGGHGLTTNISRRGRRTTVGIPGTGVSYSETTPWSSDDAERANGCPACSRRVGKTARFCANCGAPVR